MSFISFLGLDYNLIYTIPMMISVMLFLIQLMFLPGGDHNLDHDVSHDVDHHFDHDASHTTVHEIGHEMYTEGSILYRAFSFLNLGKVPFMYGLVCFLLSWGCCGLCINWLFPFKNVSSLIVSIPISAIIAIFFTKTVGAILGKYLPKYESAAYDSLALISKIGTIVSPEITSTHQGRVLVVTPTNEYQSIFAKTSGKTLKKDDKVIIIDYVKKEELYIVDIVNEPALLKN